MDNQIKLIQIMTTSACSGLCQICPYKDSWHRKHPGYMNDKSFLHVLDEIKSFVGDYTEKFCLYLMNDPFMDKQIVERTETVFQYFPNCHIELSTNGIPLNPDISEKIINVITKYDKKNRSEMWLSIFGKDKKTWEFLTGREGKYEQAIQNIINFIKINNGKIKTFINSASGASRDNFIYFYSEKQWLEFINGLFTAYKLPSKNIKARYFLFHNRAGNVRIGNWSGNEFHREIDKFHSFDCWRYREGLHVMYNADVICCCMDYMRECIWGSLKDQTLQEIWDGKKRQDFIDKATGIKKSNEGFLCSRCMHPGG